MTETMAGFIVAIHMHAQRTGAMPHSGCTGYLPQCKQEDVKFKFG